MNDLRRGSIVLVIILSLYGTVSAQSLNATLTGVVTDASGGVLQGVTVEATDVARRTVIATATTDADGKYALTVPPGIYDVRAHLSGFADYHKERRANQGETAREDISLAIAPVSEHTAVTAAGQVPRQSEVTVQNSGLPTTVTVLNHDEIARTNVERDVANLYRRVPGVMAHNLDQGDTGTAIHMRGFLSSTHGADVAVYVDGVPQNVPSAAINHGMNDMSWLTPDMIERIEVIKGPFSALYGDQNRAGAVNIITRSLAQSSVGATVGNYGNQRGSIVLSGERHGLQGLVVGDFFQNDGYRTNADQTRGNVFAKGTMIRGSSRWALRGVYQHADWDASGFLNLNSVLAGKVQPIDRDPTVPPLYGKGHRSSVVFTRTPEHGEAGLHVSASFEDYARTRALGANQNDLNVQDDDRRIATARAVEHLLFGTHGAVSLGAELRRDRGDAIHHRFLGTATPSPNYTFNQDLNLLTYGVFAQAQYKPIPSLKLVGGARFDTFDYDIRNRKLPAASVVYKESVGTPRGGVVWTPFKAVDVTANIGQGFRSPNQTEISPSGNVGPLGAAGGSAFPNLKPPKVTSYDVGVATPIGSRVRLALAKYHTLNENEIVQVAAGVFDSVGNTTRDGWELESTVYASDALSLYGSWGLVTKGQINNPLPNTAYLLSVPEHAVKGGAAYTSPLPSGRLLVNVDLFAISGIPYFAGTPALTLQYARPFVRYDARATYEVRQIQLTAFATFQPLDFISEVAIGSAAGLTYDPPAKALVGVSARYRF
jgi:outer membrane receptor protein involved in Fe transport